MHITYWYYRITQCDILSLIIYNTYISCLNNENAIVNPRGYDYFRNRWNLVILKHRRSLGVREGALTVQCTLRRRPALISFHVTIPKWVHVPLIKPMTAGQTSGLCSESTRKVQLFSTSVLMMMLYDNGRSTPGRGWQYRVSTLFIWQILLLGRA